MNPIKVLIVDDHQMIRDGIRASLSGIEGIVVVGEAANANEALQKVADHPDLNVVVMDISLGEGEDGIFTTKKITKDYKSINVLAISMHEEDTFVINMLQAGAIGYISKSQEMVDMVEAIKTVAEGESYFSKSVSEMLMNKFMRKEKTSLGQKGQPLSDLTKREVEVLKLIATGNTNREIADKLFISSRTVDTHRRNLIIKLNIKNTAGLVRYALANQLVD